MIIFFSLLQSCAKVMIAEPFKSIYRRRFLNPDIKYVQKKNLRAFVHKKAKSCTKCMYCNALNGMVKKGSVGILKIVHEKYRTKKLTDPIVKRTLEDFHEAEESNKELTSMISSGLILEMSPINVSSALTLYLHTYIQTRYIKMNPYMSWSRHHA